MKLLKELEVLNLIKINKVEEEPFDAAAFIAEFQGSITKQPLHEVEAQLKELRDSWERDF